MLFASVSASASVDAATIANAIAIVIAIATGIVIAAGVAIAIAIDTAIAIVRGEADHGKGRVVCGRRNSKNPKIFARQKGYTLAVVCCMFWNLWILWILLDSPSEIAMFVLLNINSYWTRHSELQLCVNS